MHDNIIGFHHFAIKAQDFNATVAFYAALGFEVLHQWSLPQFNLKQCAMLRHKAFNCHIEICDRDADFPGQGRKHIPGEDYVQGALLHICFTVKDAKAAYASAISFGAKPLSVRETLRLDNNGKSITVSNSLVYSPNGEVIEFLEAVSF